MWPPVWWLHISSATGELATPPNSWREPTACLVFDVDHDGVDDAVITDRKAAHSPLALDRWERRIIGEKDARSMFVTSSDIDGDGAVDVVTGAWWYRNPDSSGDAWSHQEIGSPLRNMVAGEHILKKMSEARLFVSENTEGHGEEWRQRLVRKGDEHHQGAHVTDINGDGDLDILSIGWTHNHVLLHEKNAFNWP